MSPHKYNSTNHPTNPTPPTKQKALEELQLDETGVEGALPPLAANAPLRYLYLGAGSNDGKLTGAWAGGAV
jgi:hypothetical protein